MDLPRRDPISVSLNKIKNALSIQPLEVLKSERLFIGSQNVEDIVDREIFDKININPRRCNSNS